MTNFKKHVGTEKAYFHERAVEALMELDGISRNEAEARYAEICRHSEKTDPNYKKVFVPAVSRVAEIGYNNGDLSLEDSVKEGAEEVLNHMKSDGARIILVGLAHPEATIASLKTVGLDRYADAIYESGEVGSKEDGTAFRTIAQRQNLDLALCMYLDDRPKQVKAAHKAGVGKAIWMLDGAEYKDIGIPAVENFREVQNHYEALKAQIERG